MPVQEDARGIEARSTPHDRQAREEMSKLLKLFTTFMKQGSRNRGALLMPK